MQNGQMVALLPSLRRYAHCLCGSRHEGDVLIERTLRQILDKRIELAGERPLRSAMFGALHHVWIPVDGPGARPDDALTARLSDLAPRDRAAFLLVCLERFETVEAARISGMSEGEVEWRLRRAETIVLARQARRRVLIVEDEALTAMELEDLVEEMGYQSLGPAMTRTEAVAAALRETPDLILSDIKLQDESSGIDTVEEIRRDMDVPVVFVTAFPNRLLDRPFAGETYLASKPLNKNLLRGFIASALAGDS